MERAPVSLYSTTLSPNPTPKDTSQGCTTLLCNQFSPISNQSLPKLQVPAFAPSTLSATTERSLAPLSLQQPVSYYQITPQTPQVQLPQPLLLILKKDINLKNIQGNCPEIINSPCISTCLRSMQVKGFFEENRKSFDQFVILKHTTQFKLQTKLHIFLHLC